MTLTSISEQEALSNISVAFHPSMKDIYLTRLQPDEMILASADATAVFPGNLRDRETHCHFAAILLTVRRLFVVWNGSGNHSTGVRYYKIGSDFEGFFSPSKTDHRYWLFPPSTAFSEASLKLQHILELQFNTIKNIDRHDYAAKHKQQDYQISELRFHIVGSEPKQRRLAVLTRDAQSLYNYLQSVIQSVDTNLTNSTESQSIPDLITALAKLRDSGVLSDAEFETKKKELLSRM